MYLDHYNLKLKPFNISPDSKFLWMSEKHKEVFVLYAMKEYSYQEIAEIIAAEMSRRANGGVRKHVAPRQHTSPFCDLPKIERLAFNFRAFPNAGRTLIPAEVCCR